MATKLTGDRRIRFMGLFTCLVAIACSDILGTSDDSEEAPSASLTESYSILGIAGLPASAFPLAVNDEGTIVGWLRNGSGDMQAFEWCDGSVAELPGLGGSTSSAEDINENGVIVGHADNEQGSPRAVMWSGGEVTDLGTLGGEFSFATAINDRGQIVGGSETSTGSVHGFLWMDGEMIDLGRLSNSEFSRAEDVNDEGTVVGWSAGGSFIQRATLWWNGEVVDLGTLGHESGAFSVNSGGQIVGASIPDKEALAVMWEEREIRSLGTLGSTFSSANAINGSGQVVGVSDGGDGVQTGFLWQQDEMAELEGRDGALANPFDIDASGNVVGISEGPVVWSQTPSFWPAPDSLAPARAPRTSRSAAPARSGDTRSRWAVVFCGTQSTLTGRRHGIEVVAGC